MVYRGQIFVGLSFCVCALLLVCARQEEAAALQRLLKAYWAVGDEEVPRSPSILSLDMIRCMSMEHGYPS